MSSGVGNFTAADVPAGHFNVLGGRPRVHALHRVSSSACTRESSNTHASPSSAQPSHFGLR
eukprot:7646403-Pyramimonas_sp.AAC.1